MTAVSSSMKKTIRPDGYFAFEPEKDVVVGNRIIYPTIS